MSILKVQLTKNFTLKEFLRSSSYPSLIQVPNPFVVNTLAAFCANTLQPLRDHLKDVVRITSGWRSEALNKAVGGVEDSTHLIISGNLVLGVAADIGVADKGGACKFLYESTPATTIIYYPHTGHIHVGIRNTKVGTKTMLISNGKHKGYTQVNITPEYDWSKLGE